MARKTKYVDVVTIVDGVKVTQCAYRGPRKTERTYDIAHSRYTAWHQGVNRFKHGNGGIQGTVEEK